MHELRLPQQFTALHVITIVMTYLLQDLQAYSSPSGTQIFGACTTLMPGHGVSSQTAPPPYSITFTPASYTPGTQVTVTIKSCGSGVSFKGFLVQARRADSRENQEAVGQFTITDAGTQKNCPSLTSVSHISSSPKTSKSFKWNPPSQAVGHVVFRATFVQEKSIIWADMKSEILQDSSSSTSIDSNYVTPTPLSTSCPSIPKDTSDPATTKSSPAVTTKSSPAVTIKAPVTTPPASLTPVTGCGTTKGCYPDDCQSNTCSFQVSWIEDGDFGVYTLTSSATSPAWIARGLSDDDKMGKDSVIGCASATDGTVSLFTGYNTGKSPPTLTNDNEVTLVSSNSNDGILTCTIKQPKAPSLDGQRFNITQAWRLFFAKGNAPTFSGSQLSSLSYHGPGNRYISNELYKVTSFNPETSDLGVAPSEPTVPPTKGVTKDTECGKSLGCFAECNGDSCNFVISWREDGDFGVYTLVSGVPASNAWVAVGFSNDAKMGGDNILGCKSVNNVITVFSGTNNDKSPSLWVDPEVTLVDSSMEDSVLSCTIKRPKKASTDGRRFSLEESWNLLLARGEASSDPASSNPISYHKRENRFASSEQASVSSLVDLGAASLERKYVKYHGSLMVGAWLFFASVGIMMPRFFKSAWLKNLCTEKAWFQIHRTCMMSVLGLTVAGFVIIFVEMEEWSELHGEKAHLKTHPILGCVVTGLTFVNPIMALFRPHPGTSNRWIFNLAHSFVGSATYSLAICTIFFGTLLEAADVPKTVFYILIGYVSWQFLVEVTMWITTACCRTTDRSNAYELSENDNAGQSKSTKVESEQGIRFKKVLLGIHILVVAGISAAVVYFIVEGDDHDSHHE